MPNWRRGWTACATWWTMLCRGAALHRDLRPPLLEELGLPRALEILGSRIEREEALEVDVQVEGEPRQLLPELELGLYRLTQEGLSDVRRHARHAGQVILSYGSDAVELEISDDGVGSMPRPTPAS